MHSIIAQDTKLILGMPERYATNIKYGIWIHRKKQKQKLREKQIEYTQIKLK